MMDKDMAQAHIPDLQVFPSWPVPSFEVRQSLPSQLSAIPPFVDGLMSLVATCRSADGSEIEIDLALREALINVVVHGNHEDPNKSVEVACRCSADGEVAITIRDEGMGFDVKAVPDPTAPENQLSTHGRGVYLMRALMDEVSFEDGGTVVHMAKKRNIAWASPLRQLQ
jgi:serine/threonine-protein kinase RsbW